MVINKNICAALEKMILSASGWRGIFAECGNEESNTSEIPAAHRIISGAAAFVFQEFLRSAKRDKGETVEAVPIVLLGTDTRPTGKAIAEVMIPVLLACGCEVHYAGVTAAPEIMAWARTAEKCCGFIYISASHNPIGYNGFKFGLTDGGVLAVKEAVELISSFRLFLDRDDCAAKIESLFSAADPRQLKNVYDKVKDVKTDSFLAYYNFCDDVVYGGVSAVSKVMKNSLISRSLGIVCDFNGSARTASIDSEYFSVLGLKFDCINSEPGQIVHNIVPEGEALEPCVRLLEKAHEHSSSFVLGYMPDCDGDRGNLVIWDDKINRARALEAQEVFALACIAELSHLVWTGELSYDLNGKVLCKAAVAINDPTSMRVDRIAEAFGIEVFRAEVGEANVVSLARKLREDGFLVRILGEGSAGGNITFPSAVRDPIYTVLAIVKLLSVRSDARKRGLFEIWCKCSGQEEKYREDFRLADIIASMPLFATTPAYNEDAILRIKTQDHALLKDRYQQIFMREWEGRKNELKALYGFHSMEAIAYNGMTEKRGLNRFADVGKGGLKILFFNENGRETAYIWMRGSATEPVFRIMADVEGGSIQTEKNLLEWQRQMIMEADSTI